MSRNLIVALVASAALAGCGRQPAGDPPPIKVIAGERTPALVGTTESKAGALLVSSTEDAKKFEALLATHTAPSKQDRYDAALNEAFAYLADKKYARALAALEDAMASDDTEQVRREIDRTRDLIAQQAAAERTARDARAILDEGKADDAGRVLTESLKQFGGSDAADELAGLKRQADALAADGLRSDAERRERFAREAAAAIQDNNLRAGGLALAQALQAGEDAALRRQLDEIQGRLARYDDARQRAAELRRDPTNLENALEALRAAGQAWDTLQVRQEIDDCTLALQRRRDRVGVADFEVRGDVGLAAAGRTIADELLPALKARFDVVERGQLQRLLGEMQLEAGDLAANASGQQELGRLAKVRYLILGSVFPLNGVTINARLVEVNSGLVVQTAKLSAPTVEAAVARLPQLGQMLLMTDEQKLAFEQALAQNAPPVQPVALEAPLPPPPAPNDPPPQPVVVFTARPPAFGGLLIEDFRRLPPVAIVAEAAPVVEVAIASDDPFRRRLLAVSLELGDNLFRRGRQRDAFAHFELALSLSNGHPDVALRVERCRPFAPPPVAIVTPAPIAVAQPQAVIVARRPRLVIFNFLVSSDPGLVPPAVGDWAADHFGSYCGSSYEIVERGEVCWYMGRLNITVKDVMYNPGARRALSQALGARFFLFGTIEQTASFNVSTHLIDAETGARTGTGMIHVQDHNEIKLRMQELVRQTGAGAQEQARLARAGAATEKALTEARKQLAAGDAARSAATARAALQAAPGNVALLALAQQAEQQKKQADLDAARRAAAQHASADIEAARRRQQELAKQAESLRLQAEIAGKSRDAAARRALEEQKQRVAARLGAEAMAAAQKGDYRQAAVTLRGAVALKSDDGLVRELTQAKAKADEAARQRAAAEAAQHAAETKRLAEAAAAKVAAERRRKEAEDAERRKAQEARDLADYSRFVAQAKDATAKKQYDAARSALDAARLIKATDEVAKLAKEVQDARMLADAKTNSDAQRASEQRLAKDKAAADSAATQARLAAEQAVATKKRLADYELALGAGQAALKKNDLAGAINSFKEALRINPGGQDASAGLLDANRRLDAAARAADDAKRLGDFNRAMTSGRQAMTVRKYDDAVKAFTEAVRLQPADSTAAAAVRQATQARIGPASQPKIEPKADARAEYNRLMQTAASLEKSQKTIEAIQAYRKALQLVPGDVPALTALRRTELPLQLTAGKQALATRRFPDAVKSFEAVLQLAPDNAEAKAGLKKARNKEP
jgi:tetratricopeptide (TPR) repeat protein